jgi:hypothetical protein
VEKSAGAIYNHRPEEAARKIRAQDADKLTRYCNTAVNEATSLQMYSQSGGAMYSYVL